MSSVTSSISCPVAFTTSDLARASPPITSFIRAFSITTSRQSAAAPAANATPAIKAIIRTIFILINFRFKSVTIISKRQMWRKRQSLSPKMKHGYAHWLHTERYRRALYLCICGIQFTADF